MFILTVPWDLRSLWAILTITANVYILSLFVGSVYSTYSLARIAFHLRQVLRHVPSTDENYARHRLLKMSGQIENLRQFHTLLFLLFGVCCANEVFATLRGIKYSSISLSAPTIEVFEPLAAFAFAVFVVLMFVHALQWTVAVRLQSAFAAANVNTL